MDGTHEERIAKMCARSAKNLASLPSLESLLLPVVSSLRSAIGLLATDVEAMGG